MMKPKKALKSRGPPFAGINDHATRPVEGSRSPALTSGRSGCAGMLDTSFFFLLVSSHSIRPLLIMTAMGMSHHKARDARRRSWNTTRLANETDDGWMRNSFPFLSDRHDRTMLDHLRTTAEKKQKSDRTQTPFPHYTKQRSSKQFKAATSAANKPLHGRRTVSNCAFSFRNFVP